MNDNYKLTIYAVLSIFGWLVTSYSGKKINKMKKDYETRGYDYYKILMGMGLLTFIIAFIFGSFTLASM